MKMLLSKKQFNKIRGCFPPPHRRKRVDDFLVLNGIFWIIRYGLPWRHLPEIFGKWTTVYSRFIRWTRIGIFKKIFQKFSMKLKKRIVAMLDSTAVKAHRTAASLACDGLQREIGRSRGGLNTKIHLLCTEEGMPIDFWISGANVADIKIAPDLVRKNQGRMKKLAADKAYDADSFRDFLEENRIDPCIPPKSNRKKQIEYDKELYKKRHVIENVFANLKDWRGIAMRYNRCAVSFRSFVHIALFFQFFNANRP